MVDRTVVHFSGPLAVHSEAVRRALLARGYAPMSATNLLRLAAHLSRWLEARALGIEQFSAERIAEFLAARRAEGYSRFLTQRALAPILLYFEQAGLVSRSGSADRQLHQTQRSGFAAIPEVRDGQRLGPWLKDSSPCRRSGQQQAGGEQDQRRQAGERHRRMTAAAGTAALLGGGETRTSDGQQVSVVGPGLAAVTGSVVARTGRRQSLCVVAGGGVGGGVVAGQLVHGEQGESDDQDREPQDQPRPHSACVRRRSWPGPVHGSHRTRR